MKVTDDFKVVKILLSVLNSLPCTWEEALDDESYVRVARYLINRDRDMYEDMIEGKEHLFTEEEVKRYHDKWGRLA